MPAASADYDYAEITVNLEELHSSANIVISHCTNVNYWLGRINDTLSNLALAWTGPSATDAEQVSADWNNLMTELFGTQADPDLGILNVLAGGLNTAWQNYANNEYAVSKMFGDFYNAVSAIPSGGSGDSAPQSVTDGTTYHPNPPYHDTSVNEHYYLYSVNGSGS